MIKTGLIILLPSLMILLLWCKSFAQTQSEMNEIYKRILDEYKSESVFIEKYQVAI